ncbi:tRNA dihydrouridine synthase DusB [Antarcticirhabdus aurantiaca]|uniref:tRNA dihydrouridine synthase DusB n=1 Tax=Antarcticirhabdus aurantiaca TaxID=2606717 RepID=A0ACD4NVQ4_9HYPH|nr:tRNA dihydrouridine synthase DusB [Antarcticirhabdus aurantiaca]WAJ30907.1 tRNA dihydrouridine synthase DusB [Jeongeuplla avenae]
MCDVVGAENLIAPLVVGCLTLPNRAFLAPLSGITDVPFRRLARGFGAGMVVSEMVASGELAKGNDEARLRAMRDGEGIHAVQLAGRDPAWMAEATRRLVDGGVDLVDINFGCPAKKVVGGLSGSALMREPDIAISLVDAVLGAAGCVPVTVKMRLGWDEQSLNAPEIAGRAVEAGAAMVTVHGRTRAQFYEGQADWHAIRRVREAVPVPLVANGDLIDPAQASSMLAASGADAVMTGRGAQGRPWLPALIGGAVDAAALAAVDLGDLVCGHHAAMLEHYGVPAGIRHARKHLGWYLDRLASVDPSPGLAGDRAALMTATDAGILTRTLRRLFAGTSAFDVEPFFHRPATRSEAA